MTSATRWATFAASVANAQPREPLRHARRGDGVAKGVRAGTVRA